MDTGTLVGAVCIGSLAALLIFAYFHDRKRGLRNGARRARTGVPGPVGGTDVGYHPFTADGSGSNHCGNDSYSGGGGGDSGGAPSC